jgi:ribosome-associated protein
VAPDDGWVRVNSACRIPVSELEWLVSRSGGPGGQHANTSDTRVEVRFRVDESAALGPRQRARLLQRLGPVVTAVATDSRSQARNRELALDRLRSKLADGLRVDKPRRPTRPTLSSTDARIEDKRRRSEVKRARQRPDLDD